MSDDLAYTGGGYSSPAQTCSICGKTLSRYNKTGRCYHHPDPEKERRQQQIEALREKADRRARASEVAEAERARLREIASERKIEAEESKVIPEIIVRSACAGLGFSLEELVVKSRKVELAEARQIVMYLLHLDSTLSSVAIGELLGGRDHTTVLHGIAKIEEQIKTNPVLALRIENLREEYVDLLPSADETPT